MKCGDKIKDLESGKIYTIFDIDYDIDKVVVRLGFKEEYEHIFNGFRRVITEKDLLTKYKIIPYE